MARCSGKATVEGMRELNKVAAALNRTCNMVLKINLLNPNGKSRILGESDANLMSEEKDKSQGGY